MRQPLNDPCAWQGREMIENPRWQRDLTPAEIEEIDHASRALDRDTCVFAGRGCERSPLLQSETRCRRSDRPSCG